MTNQSCCYSNSYQLDALELPVRERIRQWFRCWQLNRRSRGRLRELDARELEDIGISRAQALKEAAKPFWQWGACPARREARS